MTLPLECIESILDHLNDRTRIRDLVSLLTINRGFFYASVRRLYSDPFKTIHACEGYQIRATRGLLVLILRYSPSQNADVQSLRSLLSTELNALPTKPTVDYLSLIKVISYGASPPSLFSIDDEDFFFVDESCYLDESGHLLCARTGLCDIMGWAACGHRLPDVRDIEISWGGLDRYRHVVDDMTLMRSIRLRTVDIPSEPFDSWSNFQGIIVRSRLDSILHFLDKWSEARAKLGDNQSPVEIRLVDYSEVGEWWENAPFNLLLREVLNRMPVSGLREISTWNKIEWSKFCAHPHEFDLSRLRSFVADEGYFSKANGRRPRQSITSVLQQSRSLQQLDLRFSLTTDVDLFGWAAEERRFNEQLSKDDPRRHHLVPLLELKLVHVNTTAWQNALFAFGTTLKSVTIRVDCDVSHVDLSAFHNMPELQFLDISTKWLQSSKNAVPFSGCPRLEVVQLQFGRPVNSEQFERWDLPRLKTLQLAGSFCHHFNPATLQTTSRLEDVIIYDSNSLEYTWDMTPWVNLPTLRYIYLTGAMARAFRWRMLDQWPKLDTLVLYIRDANTSVDYCGPMSDLAVQPGMNALVLLEKSVSHDTLFEQMPRVFPNLTTLYLQGCIVLSEAQQAELKAKFPLLESFEVL